MYINTCHHKSLDPLTPDWEAEGVAAVLGLRRQESSLSFHQLLLQTPVFQNPGSGVWLAQRLLLARGGEHSTGDSCITFIPTRVRRVYEACES